MTYKVLRAEFQKLLNFRSDLSAFMASAAFIGLILAVAKLAWSTPKPLIMFLGVIFLSWSASYSILKSQFEIFDFSSSLLKRLAVLIFPWVLLSTSILFAIYHVDRAGWIWFKLTGYYSLISEDYSSRVNLTADDFVRHYPSFVIDLNDPSRLVLPRGDHIFKETVVIPRGYSLIIQPGANIRFGTGRSLISYGPVLARGTEEEPIRITSLYHWFKWGALGIVRAQESVFENVYFENARQASVNGVDFLGGLSLIESDAEIRYSRFEDMYGKDALYVYRGHVVIQDNFFQNTYKDCLDLDGGEGEISSNLFLNCGDEGIDLSENYAVKVFDNRVLGRNGGRITADNYLDEIISLNTLGFSNDK